MKKVIKCRIRNKPQHSLDFEPFSLNRKNSKFVSQEEWEEFKNKIRNDKKFVIKKGNVWEEDEYIYCKDEYYKDENREGYLIGFKKVVEVIA